MIMLQNVQYHRLTRYSESSAPPCVSTVSRRACCGDVWLRVLRHKPNRAVSHFLSAETGPSVVGLTAQPSENGSPNRKPRREREVSSP